MKVVIGSDKSGFTLKEAIKAHLLEQGHEVEDCGTIDLEHVKPYFITAAAMAPKIQSGEYGKGILICGTGAGMAIVANKYKGVYAMPCTDIYDARMCRAINDANVMTMGGWKIAPEVGCEMADIFLRTGFTEGLEEWRQEFLKGAKGKVFTLEEEIYG
ncbi:MAG: RpiB/LacA/LacB family sugar-phosphate isomerase [Clostridiales bacterium]|nr:RpiB/LacA/LacB family sugar-phosphate isomerase [Clostridiales bacterium]